MHVQVIPSVKEAGSAKFNHKTAIAIDVLRATSTIVTALAAGAVSVIPAETVMDARALQRPGDIVGGERFSRKIAGFEFGNSPREYTEQAVGGRRVILTTTNGTRAIHKSMRADTVIAASLLNAEASARFALEQRRDIVILCAGSHDDFAIEDGLCAGLLVEHLKQMCPSAVELDDFGGAMHALYRANADSVLDTLMNSQSGKRLQKLGSAEDIYECAKVDSISIVPYLNGDQLILK
ncbi:2-phosphosulfolactate phosphatase [Paenibacillus nanensis]|uniref:Probable 2-phosphosulfolactate phosphatase n=1 Tax=Paenibacillus nanensis TaxID=393251 RepID=A0A3A1V455_9BACL|nr:2-phosphosulfolactate phosphatase [Paenibacillus nanensis]RIX53383.1 2-phosphosulfolactate phosphatase [Paenibacillus nanensis]